MYDCIFSPSKYVSIVSGVLLLKLTGILFEGLSQVAAKATDNHLKLLTKCSVYMEAIS